MTYRSATHLSAALVLFVLVASSGQPARAQVESREGIALQNQILDLRRQMQALQDQSGRGGGSPTYLGRGAYPPPSSGSSDLVAQLLTRVDALEEQVRQLRGRIDQTQNEVQRQGAELGKRMEDMAFQAQNPQGSALGGPPPGPRPAPMQAAPPPPQPPGNLALLPPSTSLGGPPRTRARSGARRNWRSRRAMQHWRGATIRPPNRRRGRCCPATAPRRAPMMRSSCSPRR